MRKIKLYNFHSGSYEYEKTFGDTFLRTVYLSNFSFLFRPIFNSKLFSKIYSLSKKSKRSKDQIQKFIKDFDIDDSEFYPLGESYQCFNDYFIRRFKEAKRPFSPEAQDFCAPCEARYLVFDHEDSRRFSVKDRTVNLEELLRDKKLASEFKDCTIVIARLAPVDYHHFHFPDDGELLSSYVVCGKLDSVTPIATSYKMEIFLENERVINRFMTSNFGELIYIEVGALAVGKIIQSHTQKEFKRGQVKGHFEFGGSTVICLIKKDRIIFDHSIINNSKNNIESKINLGTVIGKGRVK